MTRHLQAVPSPPESLTEFDTRVEATRMNLMDIARALILENPATQKETSA